MKNYFERAVDLIADVVFNSTFPEKEMIKEKEVVLDEIRSYLDNPSEQIFDDFEGLVFANHALGNSILGSTQSVSNFKRKDLVDFISQNYFTDRMVFSVTGDLVFDDVKNVIEKYFSVAKKKLHHRMQAKFKGYKPKHVIEQKTTEQAHYITGNVAMSYHHPQRISMVLLNNILGGPAMNSKLNLAIREKYGYTYNIESNYIAFNDTGLFNLYLATEKKYLNRTIDLVKKVLNKFCDEKLKAHQLNQYKNQLMGQIALSQENKSGIMLGIGRSLLNYNKVDTLDEIFKKIEKITPENIIDVANKVFDQNKMSTMVFMNE
jgi:predicted Zn-dependent peptidase